MSQKQLQEVSLRHVEKGTPHPAQKPVEEEKSESEKAIEEVQARLEKTLPAEPEEPEPSEWDED